MTTNPETQHETQRRDDPDPANGVKDLDARWTTIKGRFVDEPRSAVTEADELVGQVLDELQRSLRTQRETIGTALESDSTSTEELRTAMHDYRTMIDQLLTIGTR